MIVYILESVEEHLAKSSHSLHPLTCSVVRKRTAANNSAVSFAPAQPSLLKIACYKANQISDR